MKTGSDGLVLGKGNPWLAFAQDDGVFYSGRDCAEIAFCALLLENIKKRLVCGELARGLLNWVYEPSQSPSGARTSDCAAYAGMETDVVDAFDLAGSFGRLGYERAGWV